MTDSKEKTETVAAAATGEAKKTFKLSDDAIVVIRELIQLSLLTGTNIVDHFRGIVLETTADGKVTITPEYVEAYQQMLQKLSEEAERMQAEAEKNVMVS